MKNGESILASRIIQPKSIGRRLSQRVLLIQVISLFILIGSDILLTIPVNSLHARINQLSAFNFALDGLQRALIDQETGQRGYDLTGNPVFLQPFVAGTAVFVEREQTVKRLVAKFPPVASATQRAISIGEAWHQQDGVLQIALRKADHPITNAALLQGKSRMDSFRATVASVSNWVNQQVIVNSNRLHRLTVESIVSDVLIACLTICMVSWMLISQFRQWAMPIASAARQVQRYANGDLSHPIAVRHTEPQLNALFQGIEGMRQRLAAQLTRLEAERMVDGLTGIGNRRFFDMDLMTHLSLFEQPFVMLMMDIDHFKQFNDTYGHLEGDRILRGVAESLLHTVDVVGQPARYGGEEFVVLMGMTLKDAVDMANQIRTTVERAVGVTVSIGVALSRSNDTAASLIERADKALYLAKSEGRNCVRVGALQGQPV